MSNLSTKLTAEEIQLLQKIGIDATSENLKAEIQEILKNNEIIFRRANLTDIPGIIKVQKKSLIDAFVGEKYGITLEMVEKDFLNYTEKLTEYFKNTAYFVAENNSQILGVVAAPSDRKIRTMWVNPDFQRLGIGQKLMLMAIAEFGDTAEIKLETGLQKNGQAIKFYEKLGFEKTGKTGKIKFFDEQTGEVECIEFVLKPEKIAEILKNETQRQPEIQDQNSNIKKNWDVETLQIETERLILKPISMDYAEDIFREFTSEVTQNLLTQATGNFEDTKKFVASSQEKMQAKKVIQMIILNKDGEFLGVASLNNLDKPNLLPGIWLKISAQNQGFGTEVMTVMFKWAKKHIDFKFAEYRVFEGNDRIVKIAQKLGGKLVSNFEMPIRDGKIVRVLDFHIPNLDQNVNSQTQIQTQDKNWIINNLGWVDVKPLFRNSPFKAFVDLCEPIIKQDWNLENLQIETERLILKPISLEYAEDIFKEFTAKVAKFYFRQPNKDPEDNLNFVEKLVAKNQDKNNLICVILDESNEFLGVIGLHDFNKYSNIEIWLKESTQNKGFGKESVLGLVNWSNENLNLTHLNYELFQENTQSQKLIESIGGQFIKKYTKTKNEITAEILSYQIKNPNYKPSDSRVQALVIKNAVDKFSRSDLDKIQDLGRSFGLPGIAYIQFEKNIQNQELIAKSPILKFFGDENAQKIKQQEIQDFLGIQAGDLVLFLAHADKDLVHKAQNAIRKHVTAKLDLIDQNILKFVWIYDFPFFEEGENGQVDFCHNPFSSWQAWDGLTQLETLEKAKAENRLLELLANQYDITCNGYEISSGGVRNTNPEAIMQAFQAVGYEEAEIKNRFGHMLEAYKFGAPNHAGFAPGLDRILMILTGEDNIRETIAFPKNGSGMDLMTNSPSTVDKNLLKDLGIKLLE